MALQQPANSARKPAVGMVIACRQSQRVAVAMPMTVGQALFRGSALVTI